MSSSYKREAKKGYTTDVQDSQVVQGIFVRPGGDGSQAIQIVDNTTGGNAWQTATASRLTPVAFSYELGNSASEITPHGPGIAWASVNVGQLGIDLIPGVYEVNLDAYAVTRATSTLGMACVTADISTGSETDTTVHRPYEGRSLTAINLEMNPTRTFNLKLSTRTRLRFAMVQRQVGGDIDLRFLSYVITRLGEDY